MSVPSPPLLSVVIPTHNEAPSLPGLIAEICVALDQIGDYEIVVVDDGSSDDSVAVLTALQQHCARLRVLQHGCNAGQSSALLNGVRQARGLWIGTLDGDGQNDPADLPRLLAELHQSGDPRLKLVQGWRVRRSDNATTRLASIIANWVRSTLLADATPDSACGIRVVERAALLRLPAFDHMHRFLPALIRQQGWCVASVAVSHRPRTSGRSHYGIWKRAWAGMVDLLGVAWLGRRGLLAEVSELGGHPGRSGSGAQSD